MLTVLRMNDLKDTSFVLKLWFNSMVAALAAANSGRMVNAEAASDFKEELCDILYRRIFRLIFFLANKP